jgi:hypothetical protein
MAKLISKSGSTYIAWLVLDYRTNKTISLYVFDTLPILLVVFLYNIFFPANYLKHLGFKLPKEHHGVASDVEAMDKQQSATSESVQ